MDQELTARELERRAFIKRAGLVAGATVWAVPTVQSLASPAFAVGSPANGCPPENLVRFKFDVTSCTGGTFSSGDGGGPAAECLGDVDGYHSTTKTVNSSGCYGGVCVQVTLTCKDGEADTATVRVTNGGQLLDVDAKAGGKDNLECDDATANPDGSYTANLTKGISFIAGVFCVPTPA